jgi:hypothetical protein
MSDRFTRDERPATHRDTADGDLARRARQQMRRAVSNLRAGFGPELVSTPTDLDEQVETDAAGERFTTKRTEP